jgi:hypothetical protein
MNEVRVQHTKDGEVFIFVNGHQHRLPPKGKDLVFDASTNYQNRTEWNYQTYSRFQNGENPEDAS